MNFVGDITYFNAVVVVDDPRKGLELNLRFSLRMVWQEA